MNIDILTLFPDAVTAYTGISILGRAQERGHIAIRAHQIREYTTNKQMQVDDYPYGGGRGAVMQADPLYRCWAHVVEVYGPGRTIFLSPCGRTFDQSVARELKERYEHLILVCGHYEGVDQRFLDECVDEEISMGDFVLTGGELPAMAVADAVCRMVPACCRTRSALRRSPTGTAFWNIPSTPAPPCGTTGRCRRSCSPATTARWTPGGKRRATSAPCADARTSSPGSMRAS